MSNQITRCTTRITGCCHKKTATNNHILDTELQNLTQSENQNPIIRQDQRRASSGPAGVPGQVGANTGLAGEHRALSGTPPAEVLNRRPSQQASAPPVSYSSATNQLSFVPGVPLF